MPSQLAAASQPSVPAKDNRMQEWTAARAVIDKFDGYQSDLRKYGFTLVTGLLTITGLFSSSPSVSYPSGAKFGVITSILALITALSFLDAQYRYLQKGAALRARVLESALNLDLTNAIAEYLEVGRFESHYTALYLGFATSTLAVGLAVLWSAPLLAPLLLAVFAGAVVGILVLNPGEIAGLSDFSVDQKVVVVGSPVRLTYTNLASSWAKIFAPSERNERKLWLRRLRNKNIHLFLLPTGELAGPQTPVQAPVQAPVGNQPLAARIKTAVLAPPHLEFGYMAQTDWIWTPEEPGLYEGWGQLQIGFIEGNVECPESERGKGNKFRLVVQVLPKPKPSPSQSADEGSDLGHTEVVFNPGKPR